MLPHRYAEFSENGNIEYADLRAFGWENQAC